MKIKGWQCPICHTNILGDKEVEKHKLQHPDNPKAFCPQHGYPLPCDKCGLGKDDQAIIEERKRIGKYLDKATNQDHNITAIIMIHGLTESLKQGKLPEGA